MWCVSPTLYHYFIHNRNNIINGRGVFATWRTDRPELLGKIECKSKQPSSLHQSSESGHTNAEDYGPRRKYFILIIYMNVYSHLLLYEFYSYTVDILGI